MIKLLLNQLSINSFSYSLITKISIKYKVLYYLVRFIILFWDIVIGIPIALYHYISSVITKQKDKIAIVVIAKNESEYIEEWVAFHKTIGFDNIILYDNDSTDGMIYKIIKYIEEGYIIYHKLSGDKQQLNAYNDATKRYKNKFKYIAYIDCDEFIVPPINSKGSIKDVLDRYLKKHNFAGGIVLNWCMYGSSGHQKKPEGLLIENFLYRAKTKEGKGNNCIKTIAKPECIYKYAHPHYPLYKSFFHNIDFKGKIISGWVNIIDEYEGLRINHYFTKSKEEWISRRALGMADRGTNSKRTIEEFYEHDNNDVYDDTATYYSKAIKSIMNNK